MKKYIIDYGFNGRAEFYTDAKDVESRFCTLAGTCFGIRKSIMWVIIREMIDDDRVSKCHEELRFSGDRYIWREDGARKMLEPWLDEEWDMNYCDECRRGESENAGRD